MVDRKLVLDENLIARVGMLIAGGYTLYVGITEWSRMGDSLHPWMIALSFLTYLFAFALIVLAVSGFKVPHTAYWILAAFIFAIVIQFYMQLADQPRSYSTDNLAFTHYAAELFLQGKNPYVEDYTPAFSEFKVSPYSRTPTLDGTDEALLTYPALHFLLYIPYILAGINDMHLIVLIFHLLVMISVFLAAPPPIRPLVLIPFFIDPSLVNYSLATVSDFIWVFFTLMAAVLFRRHRSMSALFFGLACSVKQQPWFLAPFLVIMLWRESRQNALTRSEAGLNALTYMNIALGAFLLINLPFIIWSPAAWVHGILSPLIDSLITYGQGFSTLTQAGLAPLGKPVYTALMLLVMFVLLVLYWKEYPRLKRAMWFFPAIILWFSYRSLQSYFVYLVPLMMFEVTEIMRDRPVLELAGPRSHMPEIAGRPRMRFRAGLVSASALVFLSMLAGCGGYYTLTHQQASVDLTRLFLTSDRVPALDGIQLQVSNPTNRLMEPNFWVKMTGNQMLPWDTVSGPAVLGPGQTASFSIRPTYPEYDVPFGASATVILMDSSSGSISGYSPAFAVNPDQNSSLINSNLKFWIAGSGLAAAHPFDWGLTAEGNATMQDVALVPAERAGQACLDLSYKRRASTDGWGRLVFDQWAEFPDQPLRIRVFPETLSALPETISSSPVAPTTAFGLEILDGGHRLWYLFSNSQELEWTDGSSAYHSLITPSGRWSTVTIDVAGDYKRFGWQLPSIQPVPGDIFNSDQRRVNFRFFIGTSSADAQMLAGCVGPITELNR